MTGTPKSTDHVQVPLGLMLDPGAPRNGIAIWAAFASFIDDGSDSTEATQMQVAERLGLARGTVERAMAGLADRGWISRARVPGSRAYRTTLHSTPAQP
jgi:DNA-binding MarR family transcriptional regulator